MHLELEMPSGYWQALLRSQAQFPLSKLHHSIFESLSKSLKLISLIDFLYILLVI